LLVATTPNAGTLYRQSCRGLNLDETNLISPTTISTGSDSNNVIYSASAVSANSPYRVVGFRDSTEATAGTWVTAPTLEQGEGGLAHALASKLVLGTAVASTSGTSIDFTGIPLWARRVTINFVGISTNGTSIPLVQIGDAGGIETTGYLGAASTSSGSVTSNANFTAGFGLLGVANAAANVMRGNIVLSLQDSANTWVASSITSYSNVAASNMTAGSKQLSAVLDRVRITTVNGTDAFDAGSINISYE